MALYKRINDLKKGDNKEKVGVLSRYMLQFVTDSKWYKTRIDMYLARLGRQWKWTEQVRAAEKNLQILSYNVIQNLVEQKVSLIADIDSPAEFEVSSESSGESDVNRKAMAFLNYSYAKSGGSRLFERSVDMACTIGQDMQYFEPVYNSITNEFYIKFLRLPFYRYHVLGDPKQEYFGDSGGLIIMEDITLSDVSRRLLLNPDEEKKLYEQRFILSDFTASLGFDNLNRDGRELFSFFRLDDFKEFYYNDGISEQSLISPAFNDFSIVRDTSTVRVITHVFRDNATTVYKVERAGSVDDFVGQENVDRVLEMKKPNWNYQQRMYFKEELNEKRKLPNGQTFTLAQYIDEDVENGFAIKAEKQIYPVVVRKYYGKAFFEEYRYATEEYPFTPVHRQWNDDKYSIGDVDTVYDIQRVYNESMTLIKGVQEEMRLGDRYIFSDEFEFSVGGDMGDTARQQELLENLMTGDRRSIMAKFPRRGEVDPYIKITSQPIADEFIKYVYDMPNQMMARMGLQPYLFGEGGQPRTKIDAQSRTNFGTAQIKSAAYTMQRSVAEHARKALIYAQLEAKINLEIEVGDKRIKYNEMMFDETIGKYVIANELKFDGSPLRVSFRGTEYHKNYRIKQTILDVIRFLPQGSPALMLFSEMLIKLEEIPELDEILAQSKEMSNFQEQLQEAQTQLKTLSNELMKAQQENSQMRVNMDVQKRIAINREKINRELNKLVSEIRAITKQISNNASKEVAVQMERIRGVANSVIDKLDEEGKLIEQETEQLLEGNADAETPTSPMANNALGEELVAPPMQEGEDAIPAPLTVNETADL